MRIALIAPPWLPVPPPGYGGTEAVVDALARGCHQAGHDVFLYATGDSTCPVERGWTYAEAAGTASMVPATELHHVLQAYAAIADWGADLVHDHTLIGPLIARHLGVAAATTNHGPFDGVLGGLYRAICNDVAVIAISEHQASTSRATRIAAVIHHGLAMDEIPCGLGDGDYAVFLGRMSPDKGADSAVRIARAAGISLRIAGKLAEPAERDWFNSVLQPLLGDGIEFIGEVGGTAKYELLGRATCLLNPLRWAEPFGLVMVEALACGTPVVATPCGAAPELIVEGVTGFLRASDDELVAAALLAPTLDRAQCRESANKHFSIQRMVDEHVELFGTLLRDHAERNAHHRPLLMYAPIAR